MKNGPTYDQRASSRGRRIKKRMPKKLMSIGENVQWRKAPDRIPRSLLRFQLR